MSSDRSPPSPLPTTPMVAAAATDGPGANAGAIDLAPSAPTDDAAIESLDDDALDDYVREMRRNVQQADDATLVRLFAAYMRAKDQDADTRLSPARLAIRAARDARDVLLVNMLRVVDRTGYQHPDGGAFTFANAFKPRGESFLRRFDPVTPAERAPGGVADFRVGDVIHICDKGWVLMVATRPQRCLAFTPSGYRVYPRAALRNLFLVGDHHARLVDGGRVVREYDGTDGGGGDDA